MKQRGVVIFFSPLLFLGLLFPPSLLLFFWRSDPLGGVFF